MNLFRLENNDQQYGSLEINPQIFTEVFGRMAFRTLRAARSPVLDKWPECEGAFYDMYSTSAEMLADAPDMYLWNDVFLMLSPKAFGILERLLSAFGEFLPMKYKGSTYYLFSPHGVVAPDYSRSEELFDDGIPVGIKSLCFLPESVGTHPVFKTEFDGCTGLYCTNAFREKVKINGLTGLFFNDDLSRRWAA